MSARKSFVLVDDAPSLQKMAAFEIALDLWKKYCPKKYNLNQPSIDVKSLFAIQQLVVNYMVSHLPVPISFQELIKKQVILIKYEINLWLDLNDHHGYRITPEIFEPFTFFTHVKDLVWNRADFIVDHEKTIKNMLKTGRKLLKPDQLFVICSMYCLEDQIYELEVPQWQNVIITSNFDFREGMLQYWILRDRPDNSFNCRSFGLLQMLSTRNTSAYRFLWANLPRRLQLHFIKTCIRRLHQYHLQYVFGSLSEEQWIILILENGSDVITNLIWNGGKISHILQLWAYTKDMFNDEEFIQLMSFDFTSRVRCCNGRDECVHKELWISAPDRLKRDCLERLLSNVGFLKIKEFLRLLLQSASYDQKTCFLRKNAVSVIQSCTPLELSNLMYSSFSYQQIEEFRKILKSDSSSMINRKLYDLFLKAQFEEINFFLGWLSLSPLEAIELKQEILKITLDVSTEHRARFRYRHFDELEALDEFISESFQHQAELVDEYKFQLMFALVNLQLFPDILKDASKLPTITHFIDFFASSEHPVYRQIKSTLLENFQKSIEAGNFYPLPGHLPTVDRFIGWCLGDDNKVKNFKRSLPISEIQATFVTKCTSGDYREYYQRIHSCQQLNCFIMWCSTPESSSNRDQNKSESGKKRKLSE